MLSLAPREKIDSIPKSDPKLDLESVSNIPNETSSEIKTVSDDRQSFFAQNTNSKIGKDLIILKK